MPKTPPLSIELLEKLRWNSQLNKHSHFFQAHIYSSCHRAFGIIVIVINLVLGSLLWTQFESHPHSISTPSETVNNTSTLKDEGAENIGKPWELFGLALALIAAICGSLQTFFSFKERADNHRSLGNRYLSIAKESERLVALFGDNLLDVETASKHLEQLNALYISVSTDSERFLISSHCHKKALAKQRAKVGSEPSIFERCFTSKADKTF